MKSMIITAENEVLNDLMKAINSNAIDLPLIRVQYLTPGAEICLNQTFGTQKEFPTYAACDYIASREKLRTDFGLIHPEYARNMTTRKQFDALIFGISQMYNPIEKLKMVLCFDPSRSEWHIQCNRID